jgi:hypothetical protein
MTSESVDSQRPIRHTERTFSDPEGVRARVDELLAAMTPAEKAGQLTQYFYFRLPPEADAEPAWVWTWNGSSPAPSTIWPQR